MQCCWAFADLSFTESSPLLPRDTNGDADQNNDAADGDAAEEAGDDAEDVYGAAHGDASYEADGRCNK